MYNRLANAIQTAAEILFDLFQRTGTPPQRPLGLGDDLSHTRCDDQPSDTAILPGV